MEAPKSDAPTLPDMVMCGDHPSFTKPEPVVKEVKMEEKAKEKVSYARISPSASRAGTSEHALRQRRAHSVDVTQRPDAATAATAATPAPGNRALVQAALGSFRWPPYLLAVWVLVLVLTHVLHCMVNMLERTLPALKKSCQYFRSWTEESWKSEAEINQRVCPVALACVTGTLYALYFCLYGLYAVSLWSIEPLCSDIDEKRSVPDVEARVTNYIDEVNSKTDASFK